MFLKIRLSPLGLMRMVVVKEQKERLKNKELRYEASLKLLSHVQQYMDKGREVEEWVMKDIPKLKQENIL